MPRLVLGPLLRYVDETTATIWVETDEPCQVSVLGTSSHTFAVHGHHYAIVDVTGLAPGTTKAYTVELDGQLVWPLPESPFPPSRIRTVDPAVPVRLAVGSCRRDGTHDDPGHERFGTDALRAYAVQLAEAMRNEDDGGSRDGGDGPGRTDRNDGDDEGDEDDGVAATVWPTALLLIGDQVYADSPPEAVREFIAARRDPAEPPGYEVADFEEYTRLYQSSWGDSVVRWLLSTVPTLMIFDDHEIRDDWNISRAWRDRVELLPWWRERLSGGIGAYWLYQHIGNLSPTDRVRDPLWAALQREQPTGRRSGHGQGGGQGTNADTTGADYGRALDDLAWQAGSDGDGQWHYCVDFGRSRLIVLDSRGGRLLGETRRMLGRRQLAWFDDHVRGDLDHLLVATSIPYLLPAGVHHVESASEALCHGRWGPRAAALAERLRQKFDLEHWAAFQRSFAAVASTVTELAEGRRGRPPASITFLSGDVHYSYLSRVRHNRRHAAAPIQQVVSSPLRNPLPRPLRIAAGLASMRVAGALGRVLARAVGVGRAPLSWRTARGNWFANALALLEVEGRRATVRWVTPRDRMEGSGDGPQMRELATADLGE